MSALLCWKQHAQFGCLLLKNIQSSKCQPALQVMLLRGKPGPSGREATDR